MKKILTILTFFTFILIGCGGSSAEKTAVDFTQKLYTSNIVDMLYLGDEKPSKADMDFVFQKIDFVLEQNKAKAKKRGGFKKSWCYRKRNQWKSCQH